MDKSILGVIILSLDSEKDLLWVFGSLFWSRGPFFGNDPLIPIV